MSPSPPPRRRVPCRVPCRLRPLHLAAWVALLAVGGALRFVSLDTAPAGLWYDEALNGGNARRILAGDRPLFFFPDGYPQEPLFFYLQAAMVRLHSAATERVTPQIWPLRATAALIGLLTLPVFYLFARRLFPRGWALGATAMLALWPWHIHFSRLGFRTILTPLMVSLVGWMLLGWLQRGGRERAGGVWRAAVAGALLGATLYTYTAANVMVPVIALFLAVAWVSDLPGRAIVANDNGHGDLNDTVDDDNDPTTATGTPARPRRLAGPARPPQARRYLLGVAAGVVAALLVFAPLALFYLREHDRVVSRLVSVGPANAATSFSRNAGGLLLWWMAAGDNVFKHGPPGRPIFLFAIAPIFLGGVVLAALSWRRRGGAWLYVLLTFAGFLAASFFSELAPNKLRSLGAVPAVILCFMLGLRAMVAWLRRAGMPRAMLVVALLLGFGLWGVAEANAILYGWYASPRLHAEFSGPFTETALWARGDLGGYAGASGGAGAGAGRRDPRLPFYVPRTVADHATVRYLTDGLPVVRRLESLTDALVEARDARLPAITLLMTNLHPANAGRLEAAGLGATPLRTIRWTADGRGAGLIVAIDLADLPAGPPADWPVDRRALLDGWFVEY
jgi:hypothetical protein